MNRIAVLIPCYNEEAAIAKVLADFKGVVDTLRNIAGLLVNCCEHGTGFSVKAVLRARVTYFHHDVTGELGDVHIRLRSNLACNHHHAGGAEHLARNAA